MTNQYTLDKLYDLRMSSAARAYRDLADAPGVNEMSFDDQFSLVVDAEWDARRNNKRIRLLRQADFCEPDATIDDIRYDADRKLNKELILSTANCAWIHEHRNTIITGASGAGKSWIACALGVAACNAFYSVRYTRMPEMVDRLTVHKDEIWEKEKSRYLKCDLLIIDDWLLEDVKGRAARELLEIIEGRSRTGSIILCSQFASSVWHTKLGGNSAIADAVVDRLIYNAINIHIEGKESMRKRIG